ncbi:hypothetical protein GDO81_028765 [Engystomops pustulosus]|uniref:Uncharacterized protein n=1 Tax=Engystomops pustulosus TaxID=76066 RepID=A0AAV6YDE6_ENGPU|nr:hypothetical protein GDO81_028765 [Engystomops pustulosus]
MKTPIILLALALLFIHADALRCRRSSCVGMKPCSSTTVPCPSGVDHCFVMMKTDPLRKSQHKNVMRTIEEGRGI